MPRFFTDPEMIRDGSVALTGDDAHHISRSLRMAAGERITVSDMRGTEYLCELCDFLSDRVIARILESHPALTEPPYYARVFQALPKGEKLDQVIQKAVECGASELVTFESERCIVRLKGENESKKVERRQRIALEAAKQSGRGIVPKVCPSVTFAEAVKMAADAELALFCYEGEGTVPLSKVLGNFHKTFDLTAGDPPRISVMVGSEGGFSPAEAETAVAAGMLPVGLGSRILRTETAASFALSCLVYEFEL